MKFWHPLQLKKSESWGLLINFQGRNLCDFWLGFWKKWWPHKFILNLTDLYQVLNQIRCHPIEKHTYYTYYLILKLFFSFEILDPHIAEIVVIPVNQKGLDHPDLKVVAVEPKVSYLSHFRSMLINIECVWKRFIYLQGV